MNPVTHTLISWDLANVSDLNRKDRILVAYSGIIPDVDGLGIIVELITRNTDNPRLWFSRYHHLLGHNLLAALIVSLFIYLMANKRIKTAVMSFMVFHIHLLSDILGAKAGTGYQWPIPYFAPFNTELQISWAGQWPLVSWQNFLITVFFLGLTMLIAVKKSRSVAEIISGRIDELVVDVIKKWYNKLGI